MPRRNRRRRHQSRRQPRRRPQRPFLDRSGRVVKKHRTEVPANIRQKLWERDGPICRRCRQPYTDHRRRTVHHINGDPSDHRFSWNRDDLKRNNVIGWCESCQQEFHGCQPRKRRRRENPLDLRTNWPQGTDDGADRPKMKGETDRA